MKVNESQKVKAAVDDGIQRAANKDSAGFADDIADCFYRWQLSTEFIGCRRRFVLGLKVGLKAGARRGMSRERGSNRYEATTRGKKAS
jgi:hypothetical protein